MTEESQGILGKSSGYFLKVISFVSALNLFLMMLLTAVAVLSRYFLNKPISGDTELVELMMAIFVPLSVAMCAAKNQHVAVELFVERTAPRTQAVFGMVTNLLVAYFYGLVAWQSFSYLIDEAGSNTTTAVLLIPTYPFIAPLIVMGVVAALAMLYQLLFVNLRRTLKP